MKNNAAITITYSESVENHVGMEQIGTKAARGLSIPELEEACARFINDGIECSIHYLHKEVNASPAAILVARDAVSARYINPTYC